MPHRAKTFRAALAALCVTTGLGACEAPDRNASPAAPAVPTASVPTANVPAAPVASPAAAGTVETADAETTNVPTPPATPVEVPSPSKSEPTAALPAAAQVVPAAFARCAGCHSVERGAAHKIGPNLFGVAGAVAGTRPGYAYSDAMIASGVTWTDEALDRFLAAPREVVPGTKMAAPPVTDETARASLVAYLKTLN